MGIEIWISYEAISFFVMTTRLWYHSHTAQYKSPWTHTAVYVVMNDLLCCDYHHKWPVIEKAFLCDDIVMICCVCVRDCGETRGCGRYFLKITLVSLKVHVKITGEQNRTTFAIAIFQSIFKLSYDTKIIYSTHSSLFLEYTFIHASILF